MLFRIELVHQPHKQLEANARYVPDNAISFYENMQRPDAANEVYDDVQRPEEVTEFDHCHEAGEILFHCLISASHRSNKYLVYDDTETVACSSASRSNT